MCYACGPAELLPLRPAGALPPRVTGARSRTGPSTSDASAPRGAPDVACGTVRCVEAHVLAQPSTRGGRLVQISALSHERQHDILEEAAAWFAQESATRKRR